MRIARRVVLLALVLLVPTLALAGSPWNRVTQTTLCQTVDDSPAVEVLDEDPNRIRWSIWTTSGAATIYFREDGTATAPPGSGTHASGPLPGGASYTEDSIAVTKAVSVITKTGSAWVCVKEATNP